MIVKIAQPRKIYIEPVNKVIDEINNASKGCIILAGAKGAGKSTVLNLYSSTNLDNSNPIVDGTINNLEFLLVADQRLFNLYHICLLLKKMILSIARKYPKSIGSKLFNLHSDVCELLKNIGIIHSVGMYCNPDVKIEEYLLNYPELLLERFLSIIVKSIDYETITLILDNFDEVGESSRRYQQFMYNVLSSYMRLIITTSDEEVLNSKKRQKEIKKDANLFTLNYSKDIESVKIILDTIIYSTYGSMAKKYIMNPVEFLLSDEVILLMIEKTNGNITDMCRALRMLLGKLNELTKEEYGTFILNYLDAEINKNPVLSGHVKRARKLYI